MTSHRPLRTTRRPRHGGPPRERCERRGDVPEPRRPMTAPASVRTGARHPRARHPCPTQDHSRPSTISSARCRQRRNVRSINGSRTSTSMTRQRAPADRRRRTDRWVGTPLGSRNRPRNPPRRPMDRTLSPSVVPVLRRSMRCSPEDRSIRRSVRMRRAMPASGVRQATRMLSRAMCQLAAMMVPDRTSVTSIAPLNRDFGAPLTAV